MAGHGSAETRRAEEVTEASSRCPWAERSALVGAYHDQEWGRPVTGERALFERLSLEAFQAGLSWAVVLSRRDRLREALEGFDPVVLSEYGARQIEAALHAPGMIRNPAKLRAVVANARALCALWSAGGSLATLVEAHRPAPRPAPHEPGDVPARTAESAALAGALRAAGFRFVGPTTSYATMQAVGVVNDHLLRCPFRASAGRPTASSGRSAL